MKKVFAIVLALALVVSCTACGAESASGSETEKSEESAATVVEESSKASSAEASTETSVAAEENGDPYEVTYSHAVTWTDSIGSVWVQVIVEIKNTSEDNLYLDSGSYDLEDAAGTLIASQTLVSEFPNVLAPGEIGYMYEETTLDAAVDGELTVIPRVSAKKATVDLLRYDVADAALSTDTYGGLKMLGRVTNSSSKDSEDSDMIYVVAFLYDSSNVCIGQMFTILTDPLAAGDTIGFEINAFSLPETVTEDVVASTTVLAYPLQYQF